MVPKPPKRTEAKTLTKSSVRFATAATAPRLPAWLARSASSTWVPWSEPLRIVFEKDAFQCPVCGGKMSVRAVVLPPSRLRRLNYRAPPAGVACSVKVVAGLEAAQARGSPDGGMRFVPT